MSNHFAQWANTSQRGKLVKSALVDLNVEVAPPLGASREEPPRVTKADVDRALRPTSVSKK